MPFHQATTAKWCEARPADDDTDWRGVHPLIELHEEVLDASNYISSQRARRLVPQGWCSERRLRKINRLIETLADEVALALKEAGHIR